MNARPPPPLRITYVTHASLLLETAAGPLLTDPYVLREPFEAPCAVHFPPGNVPLERLAQARFIFISHDHSDHAHPPTLRALRQLGFRGTLLLPAGRRHLLELVTSTLPCPVVLLPDATPQRVARGLTVTAHLHPNGVDSTLVVQTRGMRLAACSDCVLPQEQARRVGPLDVAFVPHTAAQDLHPFILDRPVPELCRLATGREAVELPLLLDHAVALGARVTIPYAYALAYRSADQQHLNTHGRTLPAAFNSALHKVAPELATRVMWPGDVIALPQARVRRARGNAALVHGGAAWNRALQATLRRAGPPPPFSTPSQPLEPLLRAHFGSGVLSRGRLALMQGRQVHLELLGAPQPHWTLPLGGTQAVEGAPPRAALRIRMPVELLEPLLVGTHDPYMALYTYRVKFQWAPGLNPQAWGESQAAQDLFVRLFTFQPSQPAPVPAVVG